MDGELASCVVAWMDSGAARFLEKTRLCVHGLFLSTVHNKHLIQNWYEQGEPDCLIKTKHCDGPKGC